MKLSNNGFTFLEIITACAIFVISLACYLSLYKYYQKSRTDTMTSQLAKEILLRNIIEVKTNKLSELPARNRCLVRLYSQTRELVSQTEFAMTGANCTKPIPTEGQVYVIWEIHGADAIKFDVSNSALKLPSYTDSIRRFNMTARQLSNNGTDSIRDVFLSIYKR